MFNTAKSNATGGEITVRIDYATVCTGHRPEVCFIPGQQGITTVATVKCVRITKGDVGTDDIEFVITRTRIDDAVINGTAQSCQKVKDIVYYFQTTIDGASKIAADIKGIHRTAAVQGVDTGKLTHIDRITRFGDRIAG